MIDENVEIGFTNKNRIARNESAGWIDISGDEEVLPDLIRGLRYGFYMKSKAACGGCPGVS